MNLFKIVIILLLPSFFYSQNYKKDLLLVTQNLANIKNYAMTVQYKLFIDNDFSKPFQERVLDVKRSNKSVYMHHNTGVEILDNENYQIMVNPQIKVFTARKKYKEEDHYDEREEFNKLLNAKADSLFEGYDKINILEQSTSKVKYEVIFKENEQFEKAIMVINRLTKMYELIEIKYKKPIKVKQLDGKYHPATLQVSYKNFNTITPVSKTFFDEKKYIEISKEGKITAIKKYASYKLIIPDQEEL